MVCEKAANLKRLDIEKPAPGAVKLIDDLELSGVNVESLETSSSKAILNLINSTDKLNELPQGTHTNSDESNVNTRKFPVIVYNPNDAQRSIPDIPISSINLDDTLQQIPRSGIFIPATEVIIVNNLTPKLDYIVAPINTPRPEMTIPDTPVDGFRPRPAYTPPVNTGLHTNIRN